MIGNKKQNLQRIADLLLINSSFLPSPGLYHGRMGIVLFFLHYSKYTGKEYYLDFALELIQEIMEDMDPNISIDLENGLCGIAWGIEYMLNQNFIEGSSNEILEEINLKIMEKDPRRMKDISLRKGLIGISYYLSCHIPDLKQNLSIFDKQYIQEIREKLLKSSFDKEAEPFRNYLTSYLSLESILPDFSLLSNSLIKNKTELTSESNFSTQPLGIENGLAGLGLQLMQL